MTVAAFDSLTFAKGNGEGGKEDAARSLLGDLGVGVALTLTLSVLKVATPGCGVEDSSLAGSALGLEDLGELLVVVGHHSGFRHALASDHGTTNETVNILNGSEGLLPELELDGSLKLKETSVEVTGEGVWVGEVDRVLLVTVFSGVAKVLAETLVTETAEVGFALVGLAEGECLVGDLLQGQLCSKMGSR